MTNPLGGDLLHVVGQDHRQHIEQLVDGADFLHVAS